MLARISYANTTDKFDKVVKDANAFAQQMLNKGKKSSIDEQGNIHLNGKKIFDQKSASGQRKEDYQPASTNTFAQDSATLNAGEKAHLKYTEALNKKNPNSAERAYQILKKSFSRQKPDLSVDPFWQNTDKVLDNIDAINQGVADCELSHEFVSSGKDYHVPKYQTCERLPTLEHSFIISHNYSVGIIKHHSGPINLASCGRGCMKMWIGTKKDDHWTGWCTIYEEKMAIELLQPDKIIYAELAESIYDDYHQVYLNDVKVYNAPNALFPPETQGECELKTSWVSKPQINLTANFTELEKNALLEFKTRTSVSGSGEGYSQVDIHYKPKGLIFNERWDSFAKIAKAFEVEKQLSDGFCTAAITCSSMPVLDKNRCRVENGIYLCESDFATNPVAGLGISPFCKKIEVNSKCGFNSGDFCTKDLSGTLQCQANQTVSTNTCRKYEQDENCSYVKSSCLEGMQGKSGQCYVQEDTYDCGFTASTGKISQQEVLKCEGKLRCVGEDCYQLKQDEPEDNFAKATAYLEIVKYAQNDMGCFNVPDKAFDASSPPDEYFPVPSCAEGYSFDAKSNQCLKKLSCGFGENDFYVASERKGIQLVSQGKVIAENRSIANCIAVNHQEATFTCGRAMKTQDTDTFYQLCRNQSLAPLPKGCPSVTHTFNRSTGLCQVAPKASCEAGFFLVEGSNPFAKDESCTKNCAAGVCHAKVNYHCEQAFPHLDARAFVCKSAGINFLAQIDEQKLPGSFEARMNTYIAKQFEPAVESFETASSDSEKKASDENASENVSCQLFQGKASTCKVAVGGMQDCCESPNPPSIGDYVALTQTVMKMDALTANMGLIEGYSGAWKTIQSGIDSAFSSVKAAFTTSADTAVSSASEAVTGNLASNLSQQMMQYTNDFLVEQFGPELANMFFQPNPATGNLMASEALAATGQALTYMYYAYLAYVAFTLLVSIVYECTEEELDLSTKREILATHHLGSYCKTDSVGLCIEKRNAYCVFSSPFSRIMMEQIYAQPQMGLSWGTAQHPNCSGLAIEDLSKVNFEKINLDEWIGILVKTNNSKALTGEKNIDSLTGAGSHLDMTEKIRQNVLEKNTERLSGIEGEKVRRQAYEQGWNKYQKGQ